MIDQGESPWWLGRPLSLDLANAMHRHDNSERFIDVLTDPGDLQAWLSAEETRVGALEPGAAATRYEDFRRLRDALRELFTAISDGSDPTAEVLDTVNAYAAAANVVPRLRVGAAGVEAVDEVSADLSSTAVLSAIARSAIEVIAQERAALRVCGGPGCGAVFLATRPRQRWCTDTCGNRVRVARHAARKTVPPH